MGDTLNRRYEAAEKVDDEFAAKGDIAPARQIVDAADGAVNIEAAEALLVQFVETVLGEGEMPCPEALWNRTLDIVHAALGRGEE